jgi:hypothetical protein
MGKLSRRELLINSLRASAAFAGPCFDQGAVDVKCSCESKLFSRANSRIASNNLRLRITFGGAQKTGLPQP